ncbi:AMP-binding protein [Streptomyces sp. NPDC051546]|uniref:AMP-binding protein n=1 Tax=Streptomyces sp. NPDC051546 TaxID=3365655 RepID=UPI00379A6E86
MAPVRDSERGHVQTLSQVLECLAERGGRAEVVFPATGERLAHRDLPGRAWGVAERFLLAGLGPGDLVGVLVGTEPDFLPGVFGVWAAGGAVTVLPVPPFPVPAEELARRLAPVAGRVRYLLVSPALREVASALAGLLPALVVIETQGCPTRSGPVSGVAPEPGARAIVQFTSGSTSRPKGVVLSHAAVLACCASTEEASTVHERDVLVAWVPLFHDFGLITLLISVWLGFEAHLFEARRFMRRPLEVVEYLGQIGATVFGGPNFAYDHLLAAGAAGATATLDLRAWRMAMNGGEPVKPSTVEAFSRAMAPAGVGPEVMFPVYGMAEAVMSVACPAPGRPARVLWVDRQELADRGVVVPVSAGAAGAGGLVGVGRPVPGLSVRLVDDSHALVADGHVGDIELRGAAVTTGYLNDTAATAAAFHEGWFKTGDRGVRVDGDLFVVGRSKDMIIVGGRNFYAEDVEDIVRGLPQIHRGRCVAVADLDRERLALVAEAEPGPATASLAGEIRSRLSANLELSAVDVHLVPPGTLPRTSSGKWQRQLTGKLLGVLTRPEPPVQ